MTSVLRRLGAAVFVLSAVALTASGCEFGCGGWDFDPVETDFARVDAPAPDAEAVTVVLVQDETWAAEYYVRVGAEAPAVADDGRLGVSYRFEGANFQGRPPAFAAATRGDSVFVYVQGTLAESVFEPACSPPIPYLTVDVLGVAAPAPTGRVSFEIVNVLDLPESDRAFLSAHDAARAAARRRTA